MYVGPWPRVFIYYALNSSRATVPFRPALLLDNHHQLALFDRLPGVHFDFDHLAGFGRFDFVFHLHRLDDDDPLAGFDFVADRDQQIDDASRHRGFYFDAAADFAPLAGRAGRSPRRIGDSQPRRARPRRDHRFLAVA